MKLIKEKLNCEEYDRCPVCGQDDLFESYDETVWCPDCGWHAGISCKEFFCPNCSSYEIRYEEDRAVCEKCGCAVILECDGIVANEKGPGKYKVVMAKRAEVLPGATALDKSFSEFTELEEIILPESLEVIRFDAFCSCTALRGINIPRSVRCIEGNAFTGCPFTEIRLPEGITQIGDLTFCDCRRLKTVTVPEGVARIGMAAFQFCSSLEEVILPESLQTIGFHAFYNCTALKHIVIPAGTDVDPTAFANCPDIVLERK